jgi:hypothetical protein
MLPAGGFHTWQPFAQSSTDLNRSTAPEKKSSRHNPQHASWLIHGSVPSFSPTIVNEAVGKSQAFIDNRLLGLPGPYHWHVIGTFNTCSQGPTHRSLTDSGGGLQPWRCRLSTYHSPTFPIGGPHFSPKGPAQSHFNQVLKIKLSLRTYGCYVVFRPLGYLS